MSVGLARVTISAPQRRVDVALPEHVPLAEVLPEVLRHAGVGLADDGERHGGWVLRRTDGVALQTAQGLFPQGVRDGEVLHLVPAREEWPELEYDDVVEAIADGARRRGSAWTVAHTRTATLAGGSVLLAFGVVAVLAQGAAGGFGPYLGLAIALLLAVAGTTASRAYGDAPAGAALGAAALPYAFAGGAAVYLDGSSTGVVPLLPWLGAPQLINGSVAMLLTAVLAGVGVAARLRLFTAGGTVGLLAAATGLVALVPDVHAGAAAALLSILVCGLGALPVLAIRFGKVPTPPVNLPTGGDAAEAFTARSTYGRDAARDRPDRATVFAAVSRTEELLSGMLAGHAILAVGAFLVLATVDSTAARLMIAIAAAALLLRSRLFVTVRQRVPLIIGGLAGVVALGLGLLTHGHEGLRLTITLAGLALALIVVIAGATWVRRPPSPYLGRAADLLDTLVVVATIPVACAVIGLYAQMAGLI